MSFSQEMKALGIEVKNYELHVGWEKPDRELCRFFEIEENTKILKLARLRGNLEHPFVFFISYFSPRIGLMGDEDFSRPLYEILEKDHHIIVKLSKEEISAQLAGNCLSEKLEIKPDEPVLKRKRFVYDAGGHPIEWNTGYYRADSFVYTIESEREI
jgi:GntR family transcriptional regulator